MAKKRVLGLFRTVEELNVIDNKDIDKLIEMDKVIYSVITAMIDELVDEFLRAYI